MKIHDSFYKDQFALELELGFCRALVMPFEGGKMPSFTFSIPPKEGEIESSRIELFAQNLGEKYSHLAYDGNYVESECSAFDDMMPTIDPWHNGIREYADHGEVCRLPWEYEIIHKSSEDNILHMIVNSLFGDYQFEKWYSQSKNGGLTISYKVTNLTSEPLPVLWACHMMLAAHENTYVSIPEIKNNPAEIMFSLHDVLGKKGTVLQLEQDHPLLKSEAFSEDGSSYKFYLQKPVEGPITYGDVMITACGAPFVGLWMNNGSFKKMYNAAIELCTGGFDTPGEAMKRGQDVMLPARGERTWKIEIEVKEAR